MELHKKKEVKFVTKKNSTKKKKKPEVWLVLDGIIWGAELSLVWEPTVCQFINPKIIGLLSL